MSSGLLTTGQMIDKLEQGLVAECINAPTTYEKSKQIMINSNAELEYLDGADFKITRFIRSKAQWRILPRYVEFEVAMKAFVDGKKIWCEYEGKKDWYSSVLCHEAREASPSFGEIRFGKWSIED